jgi:NADPH:quinone reductase-like Zn-dependent oxidoreductase
VCPFQGDRIGFEGDVFLKVLQVNNTDQGPVLALAELPKPQAGSGEILVQVHAAGVTPTELLWYPTTHTKSGTARISAVPGHEFSGVVAALGQDVQGFEVNDQVYGMNDWFSEGAVAEFCITTPQDIAPKPETLTHQLAATVPIGALTAWQGLFDRARLQPGERVLIHGAAGAVGLYAVQLAHLHGAHVIATASPRHADLLRELGAKQVTDYHTTRFEDQVGKVDVVFDGVGGETLNRSWSVLRPGGRMVTIAADSEGTTDQRVKDAFFIVVPNQRQLVEVAGQLNAGRLKAFVKTTVPMIEAPAAYNQAFGENSGHGKIVVAVAA